MASGKQSGKAIPPAPFTIAPSKLTGWKRALSSPSRRPVLTHLNADTTWLLQLPYPATSPNPDGRSHFNILIDPWLQGPQSDVASWFSTQWHVVPPCIETMEQLDSVLAQLAGTERQEGKSTIDAVVVSHEFTDHCHQATLLELPRTTPVFATDKAAELIRSWDHFETVVTMAAFAGENNSLQESLGHALLPAWIGIGRVVTAGNALYYHSAVLLAFTLDTNTLSQGSTTESVIYSPHGVSASELSCIKEAGVSTIALMHGLHDVRIWMTKQLNLGALNGLEAVRATGARYWIATHDEAKRGGGLISWFLQRTAYTLQDALQSEEAKNVVERLQREGETDGEQDRDEEGARYAFVELGSGEGMVLER